MLEQVTQSLGAVYNGFTTWSPPFVVLMTVLFFTAISSFVLTHFTAGSRMFTLPICFVFLFLAGLFANYLGRGVSLAGTTEMQNAIVLSMAGQIVVGFLLLLIFKTGTSKPGEF